MGPKSDLGSVLLKNIWKQYSDTYKIQYFKLSVLDTIKIFQVF